MSNRTKVLEGCLTVGGVILTVWLVTLVFSIPVIWAVNTLFGFGLAYSFKNMLATSILMVLFTNRSSSSSN